MLNPEQPSVHTVVYTSPYIPPEWILAHGLKPQRVLPWALPQASIRAGCCTYACAAARCCLQNQPDTAIILTTHCDQMRRVAEVGEQRPDEKIFLFNLPSTCRTPAAMRLYHAELERLSRFLVRLGGTRPTQEILIRHMRACNTARAHLRDLAGRGMRASSYALRLATFCGEEESVPAATNTLPGHIPIAIIGGPMTRESLALLDLLEALGARIVLDGTETGERTLPAPFDLRRLDDDPLAEMTDAFFGSIPGVFQRPNSSLFTWLGREIQARCVRGIVIHRFAWCDLWHAEVRRFKQWSGVPVLDLDTDGNLSGPNLSRTQTRVQALLDSLS